LGRFYGKERKDLDLIRGKFASVKVRFREQNLGMGRFQDSSIMQILAGKEVSEPCAN